MERRQVRVQIGMQLVDQPCIYLESFTLARKYVVSGFLLDM